MSTTKPIRNKNQIREFMEFYLKRGEIRNLLISLGVNTALRISDILRLNCNDVYDFENNSVREKITITEKKTGKFKIIAINKSLLAILKIYMPQAKPGTPLILNKCTGKAISHVQA